MKRILLFLTAILLGLGLPVRAEEKDDHYLTVDGMVFGCFKDPAGRADQNYAQVLHGHEAEGAIFIPDSVYLNSVYLNGASYAVWYITGGAFKNNDRITRVEISNTVTDIEEGAFRQCSNLKTVILPSKPHCSEQSIFQECHLDTMTTYQPILGVELSDCTIKNLYTHTGDTAYLGCCANKVGKCFLGDIKHLIIDCDPFGQYCFIHPEITSYPSYYSVEAVTVDAVEPPTIEKQRHSHPENMKLCWTVLFVPDGSEDKYREAEFWKDFYCIKPMSEMNRYDEFVAEANDKFSKWATEQLAGVENLTQDVNECAVEGDQLRFNHTAQVEMCDISGRVILRGTYNQGESLQLPKGVSIVTVNGNRFKVAVK